MEISEDKRKLKTKKKTLEIQKDQKVQKVQPRVDSAYILRIRSWRPRNPSTNTIRPEPSSFLAALVFVAHILPISILNPQQESRIKGEAVTKLLARSYCREAAS